MRLYKVRFVDFEGDVKKVTMTAESNLTAIRKFEQMFNSPLASIIDCDIWHNAKLVFEGEILASIQLGYND